MQSKDQAEIRILPGNDKCVDCGGPHPTWASVSFGSLMCLECSGAHRGMGVHISFVRSVTMDSWTEKQLASMRKGGNTELRAWWARYKIQPDGNFSAKYHEPASTLYRDRLKAKVEGRALPTELPKATFVPTSAYDAPGGGSMSAGGFGGGDKKGAEALSGEGEAQYVARQRALQVEARERMRAKFGAGGMSSCGSDSNYNPTTGGYGGGGGPGGLASGVGDVVGRARDLTGSLVASLGDEERAAELKARGAEVARNSWSAIRGWGSAVAGAVKSVAQPEASASDLMDGLRYRKDSGMLGTGKRMDSHGGEAPSSPPPSMTRASSSSSSFRADDDFSDRAATPPPPPQRTQRAASAPAVPPAEPSMQRVSSVSSNGSASAKAKKLPVEQDDFFGDFGV